MEENSNRRIPGCGCQSIGCLIILIIFLSFSFVIYIFIKKPEPIWNEVVIFLNDDLQVEEYKKNTDPDLIRVKVNDQINSIGENEVMISEDDLTALVRDNYSDLKELTIDIEPGKMNFVWIIDDSIEDNPLYGVVVFKSKEGELYIQKAGTNKVALPQIINRLITKSAFKVLELGKQEVNDQLILEILDMDEDFKVKEIRLIDENLYLLLDVDVNVFN